MLISAKYNPADCGPRRTNFGGASRFIRRVAASLPKPARQPAASHRARLSILRQAVAPSGHANPIGRRITEKLWLRAAASLAWLAVAAMVLFVAPLKAQDQQSGASSTSTCRKRMRRRQAITSPRTTSNFAPPHHSKFRRLRLRQPNGSRRASNFKERTE
jgi:hypothetical protein